MAILIKLYFVIDTITTRKNSIAMKFFVAIDFKLLQQTFIATKKIRCPLHAT